MSAVTAIHEQHAVTKQRLIVARDDARERLWEHQRTTKLKASQLAKMDAEYIAHATAKALGEEPSQEVPDVGVMERLRADLLVADPVERQLVLKLQGCERALKAAESEHKASVAAYLRKTAVYPAVEAWEAALDGLRLAAINLMAAHNLAYRKFDDRAPLPSCYDDFHGPVAHLLTTMRGIEFEGYPYDVRPAWLPLHGQFFPGEMSGVAERIAELLAEVEQVPA